MAYSKRSGRAVTVPQPSQALVELRMRKHVLLYGLLGGVLIAGLKLIEYRWLVVEYSVEIYGGLVAAVFASLGHLARPQAHAAHRDRGGARGRCTGTGQLRA